MAHMSPLNAYKEVRLDLDPAIQSSTVAIRLPPHGASRTTQKRSHVVEVPIAEDESAFKQKHLATSASIYHRAHHRSPRTFLWRILEEGKVLSIRAVDVSRQDKTTDANLTLRFEFPNPIRPACVALSDSREHDVLSVFVLTESKHLYTLSLRPDFFRKPSSTEDNVGDWCKSYLSSQFAFKTPHRLAALAADQLLVSQIDGQLLRLERKSGGDGSTWRESFYNEGGFGKQLSRYNPFQGSHTIKYGKDNIEISAVTAIASPLSSIDGIPYAFTVSLDHRLRVWNLRTGRIAFVGDILNQEIDTNDAAKPVIHPSHSQLVKVFGDSEETAICVTYSPLGTGQFKFWKVSPAVEGNLEVADLFPNNSLEPRTPTSDLWTLADFSVVLDRMNINSFTLWTLWKNNTTYRVMKLDFHSGSIARVRDAWNNEWTAMASETLREMPLPTISQADSSDSTDKWLEFILSPGIFTSATIETSLAIYARGLGSSREASRRSGNLTERMCSTIASTATLGRRSDGHMDYEQFRSATDAQWRRFYRLLVELDKQRGEALSLAIDPQGEMPWVVLADGVTAVRECSGLERIWHNQDMIPSGAEHVAALVTAAASFRDSLSDQLLHNCRMTLLGELFEEPSQVDPVRMRQFYAKCDFANQIGEEEYDQLVKNLGGGFKDVTPQVYDALLELMNPAEDLETRPQKNHLAEFGNKLIVKGVQETVELHRNVCLDQLILLVLIEGEINHGEEGIQFETAAVFSRFLTMLKTLELMKWLSSTRIALPVEKPERRGSVTDMTSSLKKPTVEKATVLEGVFRHLLSLDTRRGEQMSSAVTEVIIQICAPNSVYETTPAGIQCFLLSRNGTDLAMEFSRFSGQDPFSTYVQGRTCLAANDALTAATLFKKAAFGMAFPSDKMGNEFHTAGYLDATEKQLLNAGLPEYYSHIVALFDKDRLYSFVIDFARLSLQFIKPGDEGVRSTPIRTEMYSRLFNAAIQTTRYDTAHTALSLFTDEALQHSSLRTLVTKMCEASSASQLVDLPFIGLQDKVDEILAQKCLGISDVTVGVPYHKILYAWRIKRSDFRGAAAISLEMLQRLQQSGEGDRALGDDGLETPVTKQYVATINALSCVDSKQAWILSEEPSRKLSGPGSKNAAQPKRKVVTLDDIRKGYQEELDRIAAIENNQFAFAGGDEMDVL